MDKNNQQQEERLVGALLRRALDAAIQQGGIKAQPLIRDDQTAMDEPWPVTHLHFDREHEQIKIELRGDEQHMGFLARWSLFRLFIKYRNLLHESDPLDVLHTEFGVEKLQLTLALPQYFSKVFHREFFRVYLESRVHIQIRLHLPGLDLLGRLEDLSAGGCRLALPPQAALQLLQPLKATPKCTLTFPSGESVTTAFQLTYLQPDEGFLYAQVGCHFSHESPDDERRFFLLKRFIKRYGLRPVGSRLVYTSGYLACVTQVDKHGEILEVVLLQHLKNPQANIRGDRINKPEDLKALGAIHGEQPIIC